MYRRVAPDDVHSNRRIDICTQSAALVLATRIVEVGEGIKRLLEDVATLRQVTWIEGRMCLEQVSRNQTQEAWMMSEDICALSNCRELGCRGSR